MQESSVFHKWENERKMIDKDKFHMFNYIKKEEYTGSMEGMRYMLRKKEGEEGEKYDDDSGDDEEEEEGGGRGWRRREYY